MKTIKIYYKGQLDENIENVIKEAMGRVSYVLIGSGYDFKKEERDLEFEYQPVAISPAGEEAKTDMKTESKSGYETWRDAVVRNTISAAYIESLSKSHVQENLDTAYSMGYAKALEDESTVNDETEPTGDSGELEGEST